MRKVNHLLSACLVWLLLAASVQAQSRAPIQQDGVDVDAVAAAIDALKERAPILEEQFRRDDRTWNTQSDDDVTRAYRNGTLRLTIVSDQTVAWSLTEQTVSDFYLEADAYHLEGPVNNQYGLIFRFVDDANFYLFTISADGYYALQKLEGGEWSNLVEWTETSAINTGEGDGNTLGILAEGPQITLLVNDEALATVEDDSFSTGQIAVSVGTFDEGGVAVGFDDLTLWSTETTVNEPTPTTAPTEEPVEESTPEPTEEATPEPTEEPTEEPTPEPTEEPVEEPTEEPVDEPTDLDADAVAAQLDAIRRADPLISEDFQGDEGVWSSENDENVTYAFSRRTYRMTVNQQNWLSFAFNQELDDVRPSDFLAEVDVEQISGPTNNEYGFLFHYRDPDNFYLYVASSEGTYSLWKKVAGEWINLVEWTETTALERGEDASNRLGVLVEGAQITLLANDVALAQVEDAPAESGVVGLVVGTFDETPVEVAFDNFELWLLTDDTGRTITVGPVTLSPEEVAARLVEIRTADVSFSDNFSRDNGDWSTSESESAVFAYERRTYRILVKNENWLAWNFPDPVTDLAPADFLAEVDIELVDGPEDGEGGLVFRSVDDTNYYIFTVTNDGSYIVQKQEDGEWETLVERAESDAIAQGDVNRVGVLAEGPQITLLINDVVVAQVADDTFISGKVGIVAGTFDEGGVAIAFDNFDLWVLASGETPPAAETIDLALPDAAELSAQLGEIRSADPDTSDDFRRDRGNWANPDYEDVTFDFTRGAYRIRVDRPNITPGSTLDVEAGDFLLEVEAEQLSGPSGQYGLFFRQQDDENFYFFAVSPEQSFSFWKMVDGEWSELIAWTESAAIVGGEGMVNKVGVLAQGTQITLLINDVGVAQIEDDSFSRGTVAVAAGTFDEGGIECSFDNFALWTLD